MALDVFENGRDIVFLFVNSPEADVEVMNIFSKAAKSLEIRNKILFSYSRLSEEGIQENLAKTFNLEVGNLPFLVMYKHEGEQHIRYPDDTKEMTVELIDSFL